MPEILEYIEMMREPIDKSKRTRIYNNVVDIINDNNKKRKLTEFSMDFGVNEPKRKF
jgi:hypothetical protein